MTQRTPFIYAGGHNRPHDARNELNELFAAGEVDQSDRPRVCYYTARNGNRYWGIEIWR